MTGNHIDFATSGLINPAAVEAEVMRRTSGSKGTAWMLWMLLGAFNAHLAYLYPKQRVWIIVGSIVLLVCTFGFSGLLWVINWIPLTGTSALNNYRRHVHAQVEQEWLVRRTLYGPAS